MRYAGEVYKPEGLPQGEGELSREERKRARAGKKRAGKKHRAQKVLLLHIPTLARLHHKTQNVATAWNMHPEGLGCALGYGLQEARWQAAPRQKVLLGCIKRLERF